MRKKNNPSAWLISIQHAEQFCLLIEIRSFLKKKKKKFNTELPSYDPATLVLGIYPQGLKARAWTDPCTQLFVAALFRIAKR